MFFDKYPYSNLHEINLDWILRQIVEFKNISDNIPNLLDAAIQDFLQKHPEYITTVEDGAITYPKFNDDVLTTDDDLTAMTNNIVANKVTTSATLSALIHRLNYKHVTVSSNNWVSDNGIYSNSVELPSINNTCAVILALPNTSITTTNIEAYANWMYCMPMTDMVVFYSRSAITTDLDLTICYATGADSNNAYPNPLYNPIYKVVNSEARINGSLTVRDELDSPTITAISTALTTLNNKTVELESLITNLSDSRYWRKAGEITSNTVITISTEVWNSAHEFLIVWRLSDNNFWTSININKTPTYSPYVSSYYFSAEYHSTFGFYLGLDSTSSTYKLAPTTAWTSGTYGNTSLTINDIKAFLYYK